MVINKVEFLYFFRFFGIVERERVAEGRGKGRNSCVPNKNSKNQRIKQMNDFITRQLTAEQEFQIQCLIDACREAEPIGLGLPEDGDIYLFGGNREGQILCCIIVCCVREDIWECYAYTHPGVRKRGLFSYLLDLLCAEAEKAEKELMTEPELVFLLDGKSPGALAVVRAMEMDLWRSEYRMERRITAGDSSVCSGGLAGSGADSLRISSEGTAMTVKRRAIREDGEEGWLFTALGEWGGRGKDRVYLGHCRILDYGDLRFYLYHVEIHEQFRGQGWGKRFLAEVLAELPVGAFVFLHVSSDNPVAVSLYKKTGFSVAQTLSYYVY